MSCSSSTSLPGSVTVVYASVYGLVLFIVAIKSFINLRNSVNQNFADSSLKIKAKLWIKDIWSKRECYFPIFSHIFDQCTDIGVIIAFYNIAKTSSPSECGNLNIWYIFSMSLCVLFLYRIVSSCLIYFYCRSLIRCLTQFLDLELLRCIVINYKLNKKYPCNPQRWISSLESIFESSPQALIQIIYLIKTDTFSLSQNTLIIFSTLISLISISNRCIADDKGTFCHPARSPNIEMNKQYIKQFKCISFPYIFRAIFRIFDVTLRVILSALFWITVGGLSLFIVMLIDFAILCIFAIKYKQYEVLTGMVALPISFAKEITRRFTLYFFWYRSILNIIMILFIFLFATFDILCNNAFCVPFKERNKLIYGSLTVFILYILCWILVFILPIMFIYMNWIKNWIKWNGTNSRKLEDIKACGDIYGLLEWDLFGGRFEEEMNHLIQETMPETDYLTYDEWIHLFESIELQFRWLIDSRSQGAIFEALLCSNPSKLANNREIFTIIQCLDNFFKYNNIKRDILLYVNISDHRLSNKWGSNHQQKINKLGEFLLYLSLKTDKIAFEFNINTTKDILLNLCKYGLNDVFIEISSNISIPIHFHSKYNYYNNITLTYQEYTLLEILCINCGKQNNFKNIDGYLNIATLLLTQYNVNCNSFDINTKQTPLMISIQNYCMEMVHLLLKNGARKGILWNDQNEYNSIRYSLFINDDYNEYNDKKQQIYQLIQQYNNNNNNNNMNEKQPKRDELDELFYIIMNGTCDLLDIYTIQIGGINKYLYSTNAQNQNLAELALMNNNNGQKEEIQYKLLILQQNDGTQQILDTAKQSTAII